MFFICFYAFSEDCLGEKAVLFEDMIPLDLGAKRSEVSIAQIEPLKQKILSYKDAHPDEKILMVAVISQTTTLPFWMEVNGKKKFDPSSEEKSLSLAIERATLATKLSSEWKKEIAFKGIEFDISAQKAGPEFEPRDLNLRFVTKDSPLAKDIKFNNYPNLYLAKYSPHHGIKLKIIGQRKEPKNCALREDPSRTQGHKVKAY